MTLENELFRKYFYLSQVGIGALFVLVAWLVLKPKGSESNFKVRESDRKKPGTPHSGTDLGNARIQGKPLFLLPGVRLQGTPHEILGVRENASAEEIQKAYRELMKMYHPDRVGPAGSDAWKEAQKITAILNQAKDQLLKSKPTR